MRNSIFVVLLFLVGCNEIEYLNEPDISYLVVSDEYANIDDDLSKLAFRLKTLSPSFLSNVENIKKDGKRYIKFTRGAPDPKVINYLSNNMGKFIMVGEDGKVWFSQNDITNSSPMLQDGHSFVDIAVSEQAAIRVNEISTSSVGSLAHVIVDGNTIMTVKIQGAISKHMRITTKSGEQAKKVSALLRYGTLSRSLKLEKQI